MTWCMPNDDDDDVLSLECQGAVMVKNIRLASKRLQVQLLTHNRATTQLESPTLICLLYLSSVGCIGPHVDAILLCLSLVVRLHPR